MQSTPLPSIVRNRDQLRALADRAEAIGAPQAPMVRAAADGEISLIVLDHPSRPWPHRGAQRLRLPTVCWIIDDLEPIRRSSPPGDWLAAHHLQRWQRGGLVHGTGGEPRHYQCVVEAAVKLLRYVVVDTCARVAPAWASYLSDERHGPGELILFVPPPGAAHPLPAEALH